MQDLEKASLNKLKFILDFYYRYVNDIALSIQEKKILILNTFNESFQIKFYNRDEG